MEKRDKQQSMLSVEEARDRVLRACHTLDPERVSMLDSLNRILAEDIVADVDIPPYANSAMDGYAVRASDTRGATRDVPKRLRVIGDLAAGYVADTAVTQDTALRIMTGAPLPEGADAIVRVEDTDIEGDSVNIYVSATSGQFVRPAGQDLRRGERAMERGTLIRPQELGVLAALGIETVSVGRRPRVGILATGDELVSPLQGNMWKVLVAEGDTVEEGQLLCIIEAMKMENEITAHRAGKVTSLKVAEGASVSSGDTLATIE